MKNHSRRLTRTAFGAPLKIASKSITASCRRNAKALPVALIVAGALIAVQSCGAATTYTWTGAASNVWSSGANWGGTPVTAGPGTVLLFDGSKNLNSSNDFSVGTEINALNFSSSAGSFALSGNRIQLDYGITTAIGVGNPQTINLDLTLNHLNTHTFSAFGGDITLGGSLRNDASGSGGVVFSGNKTTTLTGNNTFTGGITVNNGNVVFDASNSTASAVSNYSLGSGANAFVLAGGTIEFRAKSGMGNTTTQTISGITYGNANVGFTTLISNANSSGGMTVNLGGITRSGGGGFVLFDISSGGGFTTTTSVSNGIFGTNSTAVEGSLFVKTSSRYDYASKDGSNNIIALNATTDLPTTLGDLSTNYKLAGGLTLGASESAQTLRITTTDAGQILDLKGYNLKVGTAGLMFAGDNDYTIQGTGTIHHLDSNGAIFVSNFGKGKLTITAKLADGAGSVAFIGNNTLTEWGSAANSSGGLSIVGQTLRLSSLNAINAGTATSGNGSGNVTLMSGGILELAAGNLTRNIGSGAGALQWSGNGGFSASGADRIVNLANGGTLVWGGVTSGGFVQNGSTLILGSDYSNSTLDFQNAIDLNGATRVVEVRAGVAGGSSVNGKLSGVLSGTGGGLMKTGAGTLALTAANTYNGLTTISAGTLQMGDGTAGHDGSVAGDIVNNSVLAYNLGGAQTYGGKISGSGAVTKFGTGSLTLTGSSSYSGATTLNNGKTILSGALGETSHVSIASLAELNLAGGKINAASSMDIAGKVTGAGAVGSMTVQSGGILAPDGSISASALTLKSGGNLDLKLSNTAGVAGTDWGQIAVSGLLDLTDLTGGKHFTLLLDTGGSVLSGWNPEASHTWDNFVTFGTQLGLFDSSTFIVDTTGFQGTINGTFSVVNDGSSLDLQYVAVPEPSSMVSLLAGGGLLAFFMRVRRRMGHL